MNDISERVLSGDIRAIARLISLIENDSDSAIAPLSRLHTSTGKAMILGVTGAPGAGKSTLVDQMIGLARETGERVGVLAVDPSSPFSGGAVLGDRVRMQAHAYDSGVFIRSMSARGRLGGLARAARNAIHVLDAAGYSTIIAETVGVGQSELDIASAADTIVVVVTPSMGDSVQTLKAGILEIADVFALNKADQDGAHHVLRALKGMQGLAHPGGWVPPIVQTRANEGSGLRELWDAVGSHQRYLHASGTLQSRIVSRVRTELVDLVEAKLQAFVLAGLMNTSQFDGAVADVVSRRRDPDTTAGDLVAAWLQGRIGK